MPDAMTDVKGLVFKDVKDNFSIALDPDNVFWAVLPKDKDGSIPFRRPVASLYEKVSNNLDNQMADFRFSANLSAIYIDPTDRCNADCPYCYIPQRIRKNGRSMTREELNFILDKIDKYFKKRVHTTQRPVIIFHASEPLLVKDVIFGAMEKFKDRFYFGLQTNATLLKKEDVEFLKTHRVGVGISLDSYRALINNRSRRLWGNGGNFNHVIRAIEWFDGYSGLNVITTVNKLNVKDLPQLVRFLHSKKVPCVLLNPIRITQKNSRSLKPDEKLLTKYFIKAVDIAIELSKNTKHKIIIGNFTNTIVAIVAPTARRLMCDISPCGGGRCFFTITAKGDMIPCGEFIGLKDFVGGNIFKDSISNAMESGPFKKIRARFVEHISKCKSCAIRNICGAPCPAELYSLGDMNNASVFCEFYKAVIEYAFKIISEEKERYCFRQSSLDNFQYEYKL